MKINRVCAVLLVSIMAAAGCQKEMSLENGTAPAGNSNITVRLDAQGRLMVGPDAAGLLNAAKFTTYDFIPPDSTVNEYAGGWFVSPDSSSNAGIVKAGDSIVTQLGPAYNNQYFGVFWMQNAVFNAANQVKWTIQGNPASGIAGFTHTDNTPLPNYPFYTLPDTIDISIPLTITHTAPGPAVAGVIYSIGSSASANIDKFIPGNSTSVTFTPAELSAASNPVFHSITIDVTPVMVSMAVFNGKNYFFQKSLQVERIALTK
jgi:hypothetical protein